MDLHKPPDPGHQAHPAEGEEMHEADVDSRPPRPLGVVAEGVELASDRGARNESQVAAIAAAITATGKARSAHAPLADCI